MKFNLRLIEDTIRPQTELIFLPALSRACLVLDGSVSIETPTGTSLHGSRSAWVGDAAISLLAGAQGVRLLRWELVGTDSTNDGRLRSAPKASSDVRMVSSVELDEQFEWLLRCDEVTFPKDTAAPWHVHQGPGTRYVVKGQINHEDEHGRKATYNVGDPFHEDGVDAPVTARMSSDEDTVFVRGLLLPRALKARGSTRFVRPESWAAPPSFQKYVVFAEQFIELPR